MDARHREIYRGGNRARGRIDQRPADCALPSMAQTDYKYPLALPNALMQNAPVRLSSIEC
jgi:hypothetical protein